MAKKHQIIVAWEQIIFVFWQAPALLIEQAATPAAFSKKLGLTTSKLLDCEVTNLGVPKVAYPSLISQLRFDWK